MGNIGTQRAFGAIPADEVGFVYDESQEAVGFDTTITNWGNQERFRRNASGDVLQVSVTTGAAAQYWLFEGRAIMRAWQAEDQRAAAWLIARTAAAWPQNAAYGSNYGNSLPGDATVIATEQHQRLYYNSGNGLLAGMTSFNPFRVVQIPASTTWYVGFFGGGLGHLGAVYARGPIWLSLWGERVG